MSHAFGISQKEDGIVLEGVRKILGIKAKVRYKDKHHYYLLDTTNRRAIENICDYFDGFLKTNKALEFRIWKRSFVKAYDYKRLLAAQNTLRRIRSV